MRRSTLRTAAMFVAAGVALVLVGAPADAATTIRARRVVGRIDYPTAFVFGPGNVIWYVEKASGQIRTHDLVTDADRLFADVSGVNADGERGVLGIALDPDFPAQPFVYVYATRTVSGNLRNEILRFRDSNGTGTDPTSIWHAPASTTPYHNGGHIAFGPDGMLYAVVGEGHDASNAQDLSDNDTGKILRMTPGGAAPNDNPFNSRIYAYGIRNSFGFAFDPRTGRMWETENGPDCNDELNRVIEGRNYGWGPSETCAGAAPRNTNQDGPRPVLPKLWYTPTTAPTGIAFCRRCGLGGKSRGALFFGEYNTGAIRRVRLTASRRGVRGQKVVYTHGSGILSMEVGPRGLYFSDATGIYRLVAG